VFDTFGAGNRLDRHPEVRFAHHWLPHAPASRLKTSRVLKRIRAVAATSPLFRGNHEDGGSVAVDQREWRCRRYAVEGVAKERDEAFRVHVFAAEEAVEEYFFFQHARRASREHPIQIVHTTHEPEKPYFPTGSKAG